MRILIASVLLALIAAGTLFVLSGNPGSGVPPGVSATLEKLTSRIVLGAGADEAQEKTANQANGERGLLRWFANETGDGSPKAKIRDVYYQYVDASGTVHFVQKLEDVPPQWREKAGRIEVERSFPSARTQAARSSTREPPATQARLARPEVVVYTTSWCGWCRKTLAFLDERDVDYVNKDIEANQWHRDELIQKTGRTSIPVVEIDGQLIRGYNAARMEELLARSS